MLRRDMGDRLPIGVSIRTIRAEPRWWLESTRRLDAAGYAGIWAWDHFMGRGDKTVPVVECWTMLAMAAAATERVTVAPFVANVMNRHPALLARMSSTLQIASGGRQPGAADIRRAERIVAAALAMGAVLCGAVAVAIERRVQRDADARRRAPGRAPHAGPRPG